MLVSGYFFVGRLFRKFFFGVDFGKNSKLKRFRQALNAKRKTFVIMDKLFEKIGDHFNNPEMSDRILVVKIRKDGWEKLEAARRVKNMTKTNSSDEDTSMTTSDRPAGNPDKPEGDGYGEVATEELPATHSSFEVSISFVNCDSRTVSSLSCDSGIGLDTCTSSLEEKRNVKSKKREVSLVVVENEETVTVCDKSHSEQQATGYSSSLGSASDATFNKLLMTDIGYANKAGAIGLTTATDTSFSYEVGDSSEDSVPTTSEEDLALANTVIREHQLCVHSFWLALNSSYFRSLFFSSGMKETKVKKVGDWGKVSAKPRTLMMCML